MIKLPIMIGLLSVSSIISLMTKKYSSNICIIIDSILYVTLGILIIFALFHNDEKTILILRKLISILCFLSLLASGANYIYYSDSKILTIITVTMLLLSSQLLIYRLM